MDEKRVSYIKQPSRRTKRIIRTQNEIVQKFVQDHFGLQPILISRDKSNHILVVTLNEPNKQGSAYATTSMTAYMLGTDKDKNLSLLTIGKIFFGKCSDPTVFIASLKIVNDYRGCGVGTLLLKLVENYAVQNGCVGLELWSLLSAAKLKSVYLKDRSEDNGEGLKYLKYPTGKLQQRYSSYFDRNLYFYYSNGFEMIDDPSVECEDTDNIPLEKHKLHSTDLQYGIVGKKYLFRPTDPKFRISTLHINMQYTEDESVHFDGRDVEKSFVPFKCNKDEASTQALQDFLEATPMSTSGLNS